MKMIGILFIVLSVGFNAHAISVQNVKIKGGDEAHTVDVINDGGKYRLLVQSTTSISTDLAIIQQFDVNQTLPTNTYYTIYSATGTKTISGFALEFNDNEIYIKLIVDGVTLFDLYARRLKDTLDWDKGSLPPIYVSWNSSLKAFYFSPAFPIKANSSIVIQARSPNGKKYRSGIIQVSN